MKKLITLGLILSLTLAACNGNDGTNSTETSKSEKSNTKASDAPSFKNNTVKLNDINVKITDTVFRPAGTTENQNTDQLLIEYKTTNKSDKEIDRISAWLAAFEAYQDSKDAERKLEIGAAPFDGKYKALLDNQTDNIKKGGTVEGVIAYDLKDTNTPVTLKAQQGVGGKELGTKTIEIGK